jgi:hypothetical protein
MDKAQRQFKSVYDKIAIFTCHGRFSQNQKSVKPVLKISDTNNALDSQEQEFKLFRQLENNSIVKTGNMQLTCTLFLF